MYGLVWSGMVWYVPMSNMLYHHVQLYLRMFIPVSSACEEISHASTNACLLQLHQVNSQMPEI